jgi:hypothetical protein
MRSSAEGPGQRSGVCQWHDRQVEIKRAPGEVGRLVEGVAATPA